MPPPARPRLRVVRGTHGGHPRSQARAGAERDPDDPDELAELIRKSDRAIAQGHEWIQALDRAGQDARDRGVPATELLAAALQREDLAGRLERLYAQKSEAEAKLVALGDPGQPGGS